MKIEFALFSVKEGTLALYSLQHIGCKCTTSEFEREFIHLRFILRLFFSAENFLLSDFYKFRLSVLIGIEIQFTIPILEQKIFNTEVPLEIVRLYTCVVFIQFSSNHYFECLLFDICVAYEKLIKRIGMQSYIEMPFQ